MLEPHAYLNALSAEQAALALTRCCGATRWVEQLNALRPFASSDALFAAAEQVWNALSVEDHLQAFAHHPRIGERKLAPEATLSRREQSGVTQAGEPLLAALHEGNRAYEERFGFVFLVCATGKSAAEMLALLQERLANDRSAELRNAAAEHAKITRLRLQGLGA
jgi:2-oxo-4-hydroxy-4-carboxy-5-ureidoimidazoline decarboxylase